MARSARARAARPRASGRSSRTTARGQKRKNNPPVGLVTEATDRDAPRKPYAYDPHLWSNRLIAGDSLLVMKDEWARAVTEHGGFGRWAWAVSTGPSDLRDRVDAAAAS